jgi:hypothetical protein
VSSEGGLPRAHRKVAAPPGGASGIERWGGADAAKHEKLRRNDLQRRAGARGLQLRHSEYGYALVDRAHKQVDDRHDLTLDEVESKLKSNQS